MLYQLSYPGRAAATRWSRWRAAAIGRASGPVQWLCDARFSASTFVETIIVGGAVGRLRGGYGIAFAEPVEQVAVTAAAAAKGFEFGLARFAA